MRNTDENIKKILEKISSTPSAEIEGDGSFEFEFSDKEGLVFSEGEPPLPEEKKPTEPPRTFETPHDVPEEFGLPDSFEVNAKYDTPSTPDVTSRIWTTYVPRFTEVSETYRMSDDKRPRPIPMAEKASPRIEKIEEPSHDLANPLDPTAELEGAAVAVVVERDNLTPDEDTESLSVFKFSEEEETEAPKRSAEEIEEDEIMNLLRPKSPETEEPEEVAEVVEEADLPLDEPASEQPEEYVMPDPDRAPVNVYDLTEPESEPLFTAPDGVEESEPTKRVRGEFTHATQRELFKDAFLDSIMSVKVRMISTLILAAVMLVFENLYIFGVDLASLLHMKSLPGALAIIDLLFAGCLFLISIPETVRAVRALFRGKATPELILSAGLIVIMGYTLTLALVPTSVYPLFGFIYATLCVSAIAASYYRTSADFTAFKLVSRNTEKRILDNKLTRTLPEENIALDGAVDEYKSRTARIFRAAFITDFYKRIAKSSEKTQNTLTSLAIAFGAALVVGAVAFFLPGGGIVSAMSALTLVFLLGSPAALLLTHKMSYCDAQSEAFSEESTFVGETAYHEYSDIDVIAFEDTEIFGTDDVNIKRFMLYGERDSMEKVMRQMSSLFAAVGGPLEYIFQNALDKRSHPASATVVELDGLSGEVDGRRIYAGTEEYMLRHDVKIPDGATRPEPQGTGTTKVMYAAEGGEVHAKFYIRYSFSEEFTMLLPELRRLGIVPLIYTRDPNVSSELLLSLTAGQDSIRIMKRLVAGAAETPIFRRVSAGLVTYGNKINAINMILLTKKYKRLANLLEKLEYYAVGAGALLGAVLSLAFASPIPSALAALWQIAIVAAYRIASKKIFRKDK